MAPQSAVMGTMVFDHESIPTLLSEELRRRLRDNPRYSLRSFARSLKLSPGALSEILRGRRDLPVKAIANVAKAIGMNAAEAQHLLRLAQNAKLASSGTEIPARETDQRVLNEQIFSLISEWYHFAILNLLEIDGFEWKDSWIASRLGITRTQAKMAMDLLLRLKLVARKDGKIASHNDHVLTSSEIPSSAVRAYHRQILNKAVAALETQDISERDITGIGMAIDPAHIPAMKKEIADFQDRLLAKFSRGKKTEVYFIESALFKLSVGEEK